MRLETVAAKILYFFSLSPSRFNEKDDNPNVIITDIFFTSFLTRAWMVASQFDMVIRRRVMNEAIMAPRLCKML